MPIKLGSEIIGAFFLGGEPIAKIMLGTEMVWQGADPPGSVTFDTVGTHTFVVPKFGSNLIVEVWGGGSGGTARTLGEVVPAGAGGQSSFLSQFANGGASAVGSNNPIGGGASGGDENVAGANGASNGIGGAAHLGGAGGTPSLTAPVPAQSPGGGGAGNDIVFIKGAGGGAGGYSKKTYNSAQITKGQTVSLTVGGGGAAARVQNSFSNAGARGEIRISWS